LLLGYYLGKDGYRPVILEKEAILGGLAASYKIDGFFIDRYYHYFLSRDTCIVELLKDLGLSSEIIWRKAKVGLFSFAGVEFLGYLSKSRVNTYSSGWDFLTDRELSIGDKALLGKIFLKILSLKNIKEIENITAKEWIVKTGNLKIYEKIFEPILFAKWGQRRFDISASWLVARLGARMDFKKCFRLNEYIGYPRRSFGSISARLEDEITDYGGTVIKNAEVVEIMSDRDMGLEGIVYISGGEKKHIPAKFAVSTIPLQRLTKIASFPEEVSDRYNKIEHQRVVCACLGLKKPLTKVLNIVSLPHCALFNGIVEHTNIVPRKMYNNQVIVYLFKYLHDRKEEWEWSDQEIINRWTDELAVLFPSFKKTDLLWSRVHKDDANEPVSIVNYSQAIPALTTPIKGLFLGGLFRLPYIQDCNHLIKLAQKDAGEIKSRLS